MKLKLLIMTAIVALFVTASNQQATACNGLGGYGIGNLYRSLDGRVPYFAAHPPVYYSYPVPRTYGYSPFAYGPNVRTPELPVNNGPLMITNPFVPKSIPAKQTAVGTDRTANISKASQPLVISNPFVKTNSGLILQASY